MYRSRMGMGCRASEGPASAAQKERRELARAPSGETPAARHCSCCGHGFGSNRTEERSAQWMMGLKCSRCARKRCCKSLTEGRQRYANYVNTATGKA
eukprot:scaffold775_cov274-Pinguiococcus_pyrenoidosus.AAC.9